MVRGLQTMHRGDQWWVAPTQQEVAGPRTRREGEISFANGLSDSWQVPRTCTWESSLQDRTATPHEAPPSLGWWTVGKDGTRYGQNQLTQLFFLSVSLLIFIYASKLSLKCLSPVVLIKWQPYRSLPPWFKENCPVFFRNLSWREEKSTRHANPPAEERRNNIILEAV